MAHKARLHIDADGKKLEIRVYQRLLELNSEGIPTGKTNLLRKLTDSIKIDIDNDASDIFVEIKTLK